MDEDFTSVHYQMVIKICLNWGSIYIMATLKYFFFCMYCNVPNRIFPSLRCFVTVSILISFLTIVHPNMFTKISFCKKALSLWLHWWGFSSLCVLICSLKFRYSEKYLPQIQHLYGFFTPCIWIYQSTSYFREKILS